MVNISFPGIGIDAFSVKREAFNIPIGNGISVRWYGILITIGIIFAILYCTYRAKQEKISFDDLLDIAIFTIPCAIIGARAFYVLTSLDEYDSFLEMIAIWNGGIAIYGAIIAGAATVYFVCRRKKINVLGAYDMICPAVMIGQIIGRWGNFFNGEAHGVEVLESEFLYFIRMGLSFGEGSEIRRFYHPTFLYESLWNLVGFIIINLFYKKKKFDGQIFLMYITWYGFGRMFIEGLRTDSLYVGVFRISQVIGFLCFVIGLTLLIVNFVRVRRARLTQEEYTPAYSSFTHTTVANLERSEANEAEAEKTDIKEVNQEEIADRLKNLFNDEENE